MVAMANFKPMCVCQVRDGLIVMHPYLYYFHTNIFYKSMVGQVRLGLGQVRLGLGQVDRIVTIFINSKKLSTKKSLKNHQKMSMKIHPKREPQEFTYFVLKNLHFMSKRSLPPLAAQYLQFFESIQTSALFVKNNTNNFCHSINIYSK